MKNDEIIVLSIPKLPEHLLVAPFFEEKRERALYDEAYRQEFLARLTDEEMLYVLSEASLEAPLRPDAVDYYVWLMCRWCDENGIDIGNVKNILSPPRQPYPHVVDEMNHLAERIRKRQIENIKKNLRRKKVRPDRTSAEERNCCYDLAH